VDCYKDKDNSMQFSWQNNFNNWSTILELFGATYIYVMRSINPRFTYLLTYLLTYY